MGFPGILENKIIKKKTVSHDQICKDQNPSLKGHHIFFHIETHVEVSDFSPIFYLLYFQFVPENSSV